MNMDAAKTPIENVTGHDLNLNESSQLVTTSSPSMKPCCLVDREDVLPPKNLPLQIVRRRSCWPLVVSLAENEDDASSTGGRSATGEGRHSACASIGRRHSVSFMTSATRRQRISDDQSEVEIDGHLRTASDDVDDEDSSRERRLVQRTPTPYYEEPPSLLEDQNDDETTGNQLAVTTTNWHCDDTLTENDAGDIRLRAFKGDDVITDADHVVKYSDVITGPELGGRAMCVVSHDNNGLDYEEISQAFSQIR